VHFKYGLYKIAKRNDSQLNTQKENGRE